MSVLFTPKQIGPIEIKNRFVSAAIYEGMARETGEVTDQLIKRYRILAKGGTGLVIPGYMFVNSLGKQVKFQTGIHEDGLIVGLKRLTETVHENCSKIFFELAHAGRQTNKELIGQTPIAPSTGKADPLFRVKPRAMTKEEIAQTIDAFADAARRASEAGADGVHLAAAGSSLFDQFLSPFFNKRTDEWGGSDENRYRILGETIKACRKSIGNHMALTVVFNTNDYTPQQGITPDLAKKYAGFLAQDGIDGLQTMQGTIAYSNMNIWRGDVPVGDYLKVMPWWMRPIGWLALRRWVGKYDLEEAWNLADAKIVKTVIGNTPFLLVGGLRKLTTMERIVEDGDADFVLLARPLVREPNLVEKFKKGQSQVAACVSCNKCSGAVLGGLPLRCYYAS